MEYAELKPTISNQEENPYVNVGRSRPNAYSYALIDAPVNISLPDGTHLTRAKSHGCPESQGSDREGMSIEGDDRELYADFNASPEAKIEDDSMVDNNAYGTLPSTTQTELSIQCMVV